MITTRLAASLPFSSSRRPNSFLRPINSNRPLRNHLARALARILPEHNFALAVSGYGISAKMAIFYFRAGATKLALKNGMAGLRLLAHQQGHVNIHRRVLLELAFTNCATRMPGSMCNMPASD